MRVTRSEFVALTVILFGCVYDWFGLLDNVPFPFRLPEYTSLGLLEASTVKAHSLGPRPLAWSGGVNSSFLVSLYVAERIPIEVLYDDTVAASSPALLATLEKLAATDPKLELHRVGSLDGFRDAEGLVTGDVADTLFFPSSQAQGMQDHFDGSYKDSLVCRYGAGIGELLIATVENYAGRIGKPVVTNKDVIRLFFWSCLYYAHREAFYHIYASYY